MYLIFVWTFLSLKFDGKENNINNNFEINSATVVQTPNVFKNFCFFQQLQNFSIASKYVVRQNLEHYQFLTT